MMSSGSRDSPSRLQSAFQRRRLDGVDGEVDGPQLVGREGAGVLDGPGRGQVHAVDEAPPRRGAAAPGPRSAWGARLQLLVLLDVLPVQAQEDEHAEGQQDDDDPGALGELGHGEDESTMDDNTAGRAVDGDPPPPMGLAVGEVVLHHARPGHGEPGEHADGVERDEAVDLGPGDKQQGDRHHGEHDDPGGEDEPVAPAGELARGR